MTIRGSFYTKAEYQELLYSGIFNLVSDTKQKRIKLLTPCIKKPKELWSGK